MTNGHARGQAAGAPVQVRPQRLAQGLGWFSIGLGLTQLLAPRGLARAIGLPSDARTCATMRAMGVREMTNGAAVLLAKKRAPWLWTRVVGDLADLTLLGVAMASPRNCRRKDPTLIGAALGAVGAVTMIDAFAARQLGREDRERSGRSASTNTQDVVEVITIDRSPEEVYGFWRNFENLPRFMAHIESVSMTGERTSHWAVKGPAGTTIEWDAELVEDRPGELIAWRSLPNARVQNAGVVQFMRAPGNRGTQVRVELRYTPPAGKLGVIAAKLFAREPSQQTKGDLRRLKQVMETGNVVHSDASIHRRPHPARPPKTTAHTLETPKEMMR